MRLLIGLLVCALGLEACFLGMATLGDLRQHAVTFLLEFGVAFLLYLAVVWCIRRMLTDPAVGPRPWPWAPLAVPARAAGRDVRPTRGVGAGATGLPVGLHLPKSPRGVLAVVIAGAILFRLTLFGLTPTLSDDIYRYLWDGRIQNAGINPYRYAPDDPALAFLRDARWPRINHPNIPTVYPPLMQAVFRAAVRWAPECWTMKLLFVGCDLLILLLLIWWLPRRGMSPLLSLVYAWHPLVVVEVSGSGHNDPLGMLCLLLGLVGWTARRRAAATVAFAGAFLAKLTTLLLWPFYWFRARPWLLLFTAVVLIGYLPFLGTSHVIPGLGHYAGSWEFNSSCCALMVWFLRDPFAVRLICAGLLGLFGFLVAQRTEDVISYTLAMLQAGMLLTPVLEPWYLLWLIPFFCLRFSWLWLVFSGLVALSYTVLIRYVSAGVWHIPFWARCLEYAPLYVGLGWFAWQRMARRALNPVACAVSPAGANPHP